MRKWYPKITPKANSNPFLFFLRSKSLLRDSYSNFTQRLENLIKLDIKGGTKYAIHNRLVTWSTNHSAGSYLGRQPATSLV